MEAAVEDQPGCAFCSHGPVDWNLQQNAEGDGGTLHSNNKNTPQKLHLTKNMETKKNRQKAGVETPKQKHVNWLLERGISSSRSRVYPSDVRLWRVKWPKPDASSCKTIPCPFQPPSLPWNNWTVKQQIFNSPWFDVTMTQFQMMEISRFP